MPAKEPLPTNVMPLAGAQWVTLRAEAMTMIPTGYKIKIPKTLSYPLGAKAISEALEGVPQIGSLLVDFYFWNYEPVPLLRHRPYYVLSASYSDALLNPLYRKFYVLSGQFESGWRITVGTVPRHLRHAIQLKLLAEALPRVKHWLVANHDASGRAGGLSLMFQFDELSNELKVEEKSTIEWKTVRDGGARHD